MSEFEDKINKILSSPEELEKIMGMAKSLSGSFGEQSGEAEQKAGGTPDISSLGSMFGNLDPKMIGVISRLFGEYTSKGSDDKAGLITALKPYLKEDRREKIDKAAEMAKLARLARLAFTEFSGGEGDV